MPDTKKAESDEAKKARVKAAAEQLKAASEQLKKIKNGLPALDKQVGDIEDTLKE